MANEDEDEQGADPIPLVLPPPTAPPVDGSLDLGPAADGQRLAPPSADAQRFQPDTKHDAQRLGHERVDAQRSQPDIDAQRAQPNVHAQRSQPVEHAADPRQHPVDAQRAASNVQRSNHVGRTRSFRRLQPRTRFLIASAAVVAIVGATVLIVNARDDDAPVAAPSTTVVDTVAITDPPATAAVRTSEPATVSVATTEPASSAATTIVETTIAGTNQEPPEPGVAPATPSTGDAWSFVFFSNGSVAPTIAGYTCGGLVSTWHVIFGAGSPELERTYDLPFSPTAMTVHHDLVYDLPPDEQSSAVHIEWRWDYLLDTSLTPPMIRISGTQHETPEGGSEIVFDNNFGTGDGIALENTTLPGLLTGTGLSHPFLDQATAECG